MDATTRARVNELIDSFRALKPEDTVQTLAGRFHLDAATVRRVAHSHGAKLEDEDPDGAHFVDSEETTKYADVKNRLGHARRDTNGSE